VVAGTNACRLRDASSAVAADELTDEQIKKLEAELPRTTYRTFFYHWTKKENAERWVKQGFIDKGELEVLSKSDAGMAQAGGFYISRNPTDSSGFGDTQVVLALPTDTLMGNHQDINRILGTMINYKQAKELATKVPLIRSDDGNWFVVNHPQLTSKVIPGFVSKNTGVYATRNFESKIRQATKNQPDGDYLSRLTSLLHYMDGISFYRALKVNPANPGAEFEPKNFDVYHKFREVLTQRLDSDPGWFNKTPFWDQIKSYYQTISGREAAFRGNPVTAGGDMPGGFFEATPAMLTTLIANPYLTVAFEPKPGTGLYHVKIDYPHAKWWKTLKPKFDKLLSAQLVSELDAFVAQGDMDSAEGKPLTQKMLQEMITKTVAAYKNPADLRLIQALVAIHPFEDFNGRVIRLMVDFNSRLNGGLGTFFVAADLDLFLAEYELTERVHQWTGTREAILSEWLEEWERSRKAGDMPKYFDAPSLEALRLLAPVKRMSDIPQLTSQDYEHIRTRRWPQVLKKIPEAKSKRPLSLLEVLFASQVLPESEWREVRDQFRANIEADYGSISVYAPALSGLDLALMMDGPRVIEIWKVLNLGQKSASWWANLMGEIVRIPNYDPMILKKVSAKILNHWGEEAYSLMIALLIKNERIEVIAHLDRDELVKYINKNIDQILPNLQTSFKLAVVVGVPELHDRVVEHVKSNLARQSGVNGKVMLLRLLCSSRSDHRVQEAFIRMLPVVLLGEPEAEAILVQLSEETGLTLKIKEIINESSPSKSWQDYFNARQKTIAEFIATKTGKKEPCDSLADLVKIFP